VQKVAEHGVGRVTVSYRRWIEVVKKRI